MHLLPWLHRLLQPCCTFAASQPFGLVDLSLLPNSASRLIRSARADYSYAGCLVLPIALKTNFRILRVFRQIPRICLLLQRTNTRGRWYEGLCVTSNAAAESRPQSVWNPFSACAPINSHRCPWHFFGQKFLAFSAWRSTMVWEKRIDKFGSGASHQDSIAWSSLCRSLESDATDTLKDSLALRSEIHSIWTAYILELACSREQLEPWREASRLKKANRPPMHLRPVHDGAHAGY